jgi:hypothetical protein
MLLIFYSCNNATAIIEKAEEIRKSKPRVEVYTYLENSLNNNSELNVNERTQIFDYIFSLILKGNELNRLPPICQNNSLDYLKKVEADEYLNINRAYKLFRFLHNLKEGKSLTSNINNMNLIDHSSDRKTAESIICSNVEKIPEWGWCSTWPKVDESKVDSCLSVTNLAEICQVDSPKSLPSEKEIKKYIHRMKNNTKADFVLKGNGKLIVKLSSILSSDHDIPSELKEDFNKLTAGKSKYDTQIIQKEYLRKKKSELYGEKIAVVFPVSTRGYNFKGEFYYWEIDNATWRAESKEDIFVSNRDKYLFVFDDGLFSWSTSKKEQVYNFYVPEVGYFLDVPLLLGKDHEKKFKGIKWFVVLASISSRTKSVISKSSSFKYPRYVDVPVLNPIAWKMCDSRSSQDLKDSNFRTRISDNGCSSWYSKSSYSDKKAHAYHIANTMPSHEQSQVEIETQKLE